LKIETLCIQLGSIKAKICVSEKCYYKYLKQHFKPVLLNHHDDWDVEIHCNWLLSPGNKNDLKKSYDYNNSIN